MGYGENIFFYCQENTGTDETTEYSIFNPFFFSKNVQIEFFQTLQS